MARAHKSTPYRSRQMAATWAMARRLPDGEECVRAQVERINEEERTNQEHRGQPEYRSLRHLSDRQLQTLRARLQAASPQHPKGAPDRPATGPRMSESVQAAWDYCRYLATELGWTSAQLRAFCQRQTGHPEPQDHRQVNAVAAPLERLMRGAGYVCTRSAAGKTWAKNISDEGLTSLPERGVKPSAVPETAPASAPRRSARSADKATAQAAPAPRRAHLQLLPGGAPMIPMSGSAPAPVAAVAASASTSVGTAQVCTPAENPSNLAQIARSRPVLTLLHTCPGPESAMTPKG